MKRRNLILLFVALCLVSGFLLPGCNRQKQIDSNTVKSVKVEEKAHLENDTASPSCKLVINYNYLAKTDTNDSISQRINQTVQTVVLGKRYAHMPVPAAVDSFKNAYIRNYRKEVVHLYEEDIKSGTPKADLPSWYNYEYSLSTEFKQGKEGIMNFTSTIFEYSGGAHPNEWSKWLNFDTSTGTLLTLDQVFLKGAEVPISKLLLNELIHQMAQKYPEDKVQSLEDLQDLGILNDTNIYMPENFLLEAAQASFLYNKYDIAPYAAGTIILSLPYTEIEKYMIHPNYNR